MAKLVSDILLIFLNDILIYLLIGISLFYFYKNNRLTFLKIIIALTLTFITTRFIKSLIPSPRPYQIFDQIPSILLIPKDGTFPSAHAAYSAVIAILTLFANLKIGLIFLILAFLISLARVAAQVHFYTDIAAGFLLGSLIALFIQSTIANGKKSKKSKLTRPKNKKN